MPTPKKPAKESPAPWKGKFGDVMAGRTIKTTPTCEPKMLPKIPQLGLNMGMDRRP